jgi:DNA polymerase-1
MEKILLIDGSSILYRAFFALPHFVTKKSEPTGAVYGYLQMLFRILKDEQPDYIAVAFDRKAPTFRHIAFKEYKAQRPPTPDELATQFKIIREVLSALKINYFELDGYEADDVIATFVKELSDKQLEVLILTGDMDLTQLIDKNVTVLITKKGVTNIEHLTSEKLFELIGVKSEQIPDYKALIGDSSDNIPGIPGIGPKTAQKLITKYESIENLVDHIQEIEPKYTQYVDRMFLNKRLCALIGDVPIAINLESIRLKNFKTKEVQDILTRLEFKTILKSFGLDSVPVNSIDFDSSINDASVGIVFDFYNRNLRGFSIAKNNTKVEYAIGEELFRNEDALQVLRSTLADPNIKKEVYDLKELHLVEKLFEVNSKNVHIDVSLGAYLIDPDRNDYSLEELSHLSGIPLEDGNLASRAKLVLLASVFIEKKLIDSKLFDVYKEIEFPVSKVLFEMEEKGIKIDPEYFKKLSFEIDNKIADIEKEIYNLSGISFNILSYKQLSSILFDSLGLKPQKMGKFSFSTSSTVLEDLIQEHPIVPLILEYRHLTKLKSTYIEALPHLISKSDLKLHTHFHHLGTSTGRLRSTNPNLQNIPIKGEWGEKVRKGFIPTDNDHLLVSADYSQIELRILSHLSGDEKLIKAFQNNEDIHVYTAMEIFKVKEDEVTNELRRRAKTVNFGIIYGISPYGLSQQINCGVEEASEIIKRYFERYSGVKAYVYKVINEAIETGETRTIFGRRRKIEGLDSKNSSVRENAKRLAINSPIQGSAADLIKISMVKIFDRLINLDAHIILQIHDELVVESDKAILSEVENIMKVEMEGVKTLLVPLKVNIAHGYNLLEAKA